jgi:hypothetical protein
MDRYSYRPKVKTFTLSKGAINCKKGSRCNVALNNFYIKNDCLNKPPFDNSDKMPEWKVILIAALLALALALIWKIGKTLYDWAYPEMPSNSPRFYGSNLQNSNAPVKDRYQQAEELARTVMGQIQIKENINTIKDLMNSGVEYSEEDLRYYNFLRNLVELIFYRNDPRIEYFSNYFEENDVLSLVQQNMSQQSRIDPIMYSYFIETLINDFANLVTQPEFSSGQITTLLNEAMSQQVGSLSKNQVEQVVKTTFEFIINNIYNGYQETELNPVSQFILEFFATRRTPIRSPTGSLRNSPISPLLQPELLNI